MTFKKNILALKAEVIMFAKLWYRYLFKFGYLGFTSFEKVKGGVTQLLYRQRGRFAKPFVHMGMIALMAMGITIAPVLASSFPGLVADQWSEQTPNTQVREVTDSALTTTIPSDRVRDKVLDYEVQTGDTISGISDKFGVSIDTILWENKLTKTSAIKPGQTLRILPVTGVLHKVSRGETIYSVSKKYNAEPQAVVDFPFNTFADDETFALSVGQDLVVPDGEMPNVVPVNPSQNIARRTPDAGVVSGTGRFAWPIAGVITQRYAWYHGGIDIAAPFGTPVVAADSGKVIVSGWTDNTGYGNRVMIDHGNGFVTLYGHLSKLYVVVGQSVNRGDQIGAEGSTGRSTGPHVHFEIRRPHTVNPLDYLK